MPSTSFPCKGCNQMQHVQHGFGVTVLPHLCPACEEERARLDITVLDYARRRHDLRERAIEAQS